MELRRNSELPINLSIPWSWEELFSEYIVSFVSIMRIIVKSILLFFFFIVLIIFVELEELLREGTRFGVMVVDA